MDSSRQTASEYIPMTLPGRKPQTRRSFLFSRYRSYILAVVALITGLLVGQFCGRWSRWRNRDTIYKEIPGPETYVITVLDSFQDINHVSPVHTPIISSTRADEKAVVTTLYNDGYGIAVATLGHSLSKVNTTARKILIYPPERISLATLCYVKAAGWELHPVTIIKPPHNGEGVNWMFVDQYTKLKIWTLDEIGIKAAVYLDADTLAKSNFDELFEIPFEFGAIPDVYLDSRGFTINFNAGILAIKPNTQIFNDLMAKVEDAQFGLGEAEQSYLNLYFAQQVVRLPHVYNGNLAIKEKSRIYWDALQPQMRIVHFTLVKPFNGRPWCGDDNPCTTEQIFDPDRHRAHLEWAIKERDGIFKEESQWWRTVYEEMMAAVGDVCKTR